MNLQFPAPLKRGDRVAIISPAGPVVPANLEVGLAYLQELGLRPHLSTALFNRRPPYDYLAGEDLVRLQSLQEAFEDEEVRAIICSRGGYGTMRLLDQIDFDRISETPKFFLGFSDITALHLAMAARGRLSTLHGPVVKSIALHRREDETLKDLEAILFGRGRERCWSNLEPVRPGRVQGPLYGGNLSLIVALLGTEFLPEMEGAILVIEDVGEADYRVDRLLTTLRLALGKKLRGLVLGDFSGCEGVYVSSEAFNEYLASLGREFSCPVVMAAPVGHQERNRAFFQGAQAELDAEKGELRWWRG